MSAQDITTKWNSLRSHGLDLGPAQAPAVDAGFGGLLQRFAHGNIYWHATTGAHEVHGGILTRYLNGGGQAGNPQTGERELGFPRTDEIRSDDGEYPYSLFEWGAIAWVAGTGGVRLFGRLYTAWRAAGGELGSLGHPLQDVTRVAGGRAAWFERGVLWHAEGSNDVLMGQLITPQLGCPQLVDPDHPPHFEWMRFTGAVGALDTHPTLAADLCRSKLWLVPVHGSPSTNSVELIPAAKTTVNGAERRLTFTPASPAGPGTVATAGSMARPGPTGSGTTDRIPTGGVTRVPDILGTAPPAVPATTDPLTITVPGVDVSGSAFGNGPPLVRRTLYSIAFRIPGLALRIIAPHSIYARSDFTSFNIAHISDLHVSRRIEHYRAQLRKEGVPASDIALFNNWNDALRDFIRYANHLHSAGLLDVIMATGDLVDYVHEVGDHPKGPGNFSFFERLIRGEAPSPDAESPPSEALRVPVFTTLGNHDYRANPYALGFKLKLSSGGLLGEIFSDITGGLLDGVFDLIGSGIDMLPGLGLVKNLDPIAALSLSLIDAEYQYAGLNLSRKEALKVMGLRRPNTDEYYLPVLEPKVAARAVLIDPAMRDGTQYYFQHINRNRSYFVQLGMHRLLMLDTRHDVGITDTVTETVISKLGFGSESSEHFLSGSPDSVGVVSEELNLVGAAIDSAGAQGIILVGMHAPPLNPQGNAMLAHFRETMHPMADPSFVTGFLLGVDMLSVAKIQNNAIVPRSDALTTKPSWPRTGTAHFHAGPIEDLLDFGTAVGFQEQLMGLFAGSGGRRPATLVVCGHGHKRFDYRARWDAAARQLLMFTDHYLENPTSYYPINLHEKWWDAKTYRRRLVRVAAGTPVAGTEQIIEDHQAGATWKDLSTFTTPTYAAPLSNATDPAAWWRAHEPVIVQTAALGPASNTRRDKDTNSDAPGPNFQGFRIIQILNNNISHVRYTTIPALRAGNLSLPWEHEFVGGTRNPGGGVVPPVVAKPIDVVPGRPVIRDHR